MSGSEEKKRLRILTYMVPEIHIDVFNLLRDNFEEATGLESYLICEDRFTGPTPDRTDPFKGDLADVVIVHSTDYLRMKHQGHSHMELCPAAPVPKHPMAGNRAVYFSEIIINSTNKTKYKEFKDLKGCSWAYNDDDSLSGNLIVLDYLKKKHGTNAAYFGSVVRSGSHLKSIHMVRDHTVEAAAVDSNVLASYLREHADHKDYFCSLVALGPLPVYPILFNKSLPAETQQKIVDSLLNLEKSPRWSARLQEVGIERFVPVDSNLYILEEDVSKGVKGMTINTTYY